MLCDLNFESYSSEASFALNFERFSKGRLSYIPANVKLWESLGIAEGLPMIN